MACKPIINEPCEKRIQFQEGGKTYEAYISYDTGGTDFLTILRIKQHNQGFLGINDKIIQPNDREFERLIETTEFKDVYRRDLSTLKAKVNALSGNTKEVVEEALNRSDTRDQWNDTNAGTKQGPIFNPAPDPGTAQPVAGPAPNPNNVVLPEVIKKLQETADQERQLLLLPGEQRFAVQYPADAYYENSQDSVVIEQFTYRAPQESILIDDAGNIRTANPFQTFAQGLRRNSNLRESVGTVRLPIPNQLAMSDGVDWGQRKANAFEAGAFYTAMGLAGTVVSGNFLKAAGAAGNVLGQAASFVGQGGLSTGTPSGTLFTALAAQYGLSKVGINVDPAQFITRATGTTINPNLELLFGGPKLRNFSLSFEFAPDNQTDATNARRIIRFFKQGMAPKRLGENLIFIGSPNVFRVKYKNGNRDIKGINAHKICALTTCEVNYTPDGVYQSYDDPQAVSQPVKTIMTLSFTELTPIFASDYDPNSTEPSVADDAQVRFDPDSIGF
jgi:hypothetical protein